MNDRANINRVMSRETFVVNTHRHAIRVFPSYLFALGLPFLERVLLFVLELHDPRLPGDSSAMTLTFLVSMVFFV